MTPAVKIHLEPIRIMPTPLSQRQQARQAFHGSNNQASHRNPWVRRIPGKAGICDVAVVSASQISALAAFDILSDRQAPRASPFWMQATGEMEWLGFARQP
jgi:hypothetical protein